MKQVIKHIILLLFLAVGGVCCAQTETLNWELFFFDFPFSHPKPEHQEQIVEIDSLLREHPQEIYLVIGHTDERGSELYTWKLSCARARYMKQLILGGLDNKRIILVPVGLSFFHPNIPHAKTEEEHACNRRVAIQTYSPNFYHGKCAALVEYAMLEAYSQSPDAFEKLSKEILGKYFDVDSSDYMRYRLLQKNLSEETYEKIALKLRRAREKLMKE